MYSHEYRYDEYIAAIALYDLAKSTDVDRPCKVVQGGDHVYAETVTKALAAQIFLQKINNKLMGQPTPS
jgi:hypothetical protein